ncbi:MAG TPA: hypothetical protein VMS76_17640 [Planctomycetota bacterium]|nr:hypothetical protein [Planctomycetota bacterium]
MDPQLKAALEILEKAEREWQPPPGPIVLTEDYLRQVERVEALPRNQPGEDKTWVERVDREDRSYFRSIVRR